MKSIFLTFFLLFSMSAFAGGPLWFQKGGGVPLQWMDNLVVLYTDPGSFCSKIDNNTAVSWVKEAIDVWNNVSYQPVIGKAGVKTSLLQVQHKGNLSADVNASNVSEYLKSEAGQSVIIFDADGEITSLVAGEENKDEVGGFTIIPYTDQDGKKIIRDVSIINGHMFCGYFNSGPGTSAYDQAVKYVKAIIAHELGHLLNLDHSQVNLPEIESCTSTSCAGGQYIPTMYPELKTALQMNLNVDDVVAISSVYPTPDFQNSYCTVTGKLLDKDGKYLNGVNVVAKRIGDGETIAKSDSRSFVSGALMDECAGEGKYFLYGLAVGKKYQVIYEPIASEFVGVDMSSFRPINNPPQGFVSGSALTTDGKDYVLCESAGSTIEMADAKLSDAKSTCEGQDGAKDTPPQASEATTGGGCSLNIPLLR